MSKLIDLSFFLLLNLVFIESKTFFDFSAVDIKGKNVNLSKYKGKVLLVVNVASECGFTDNHYTALVKAKKVHGTDDFEVLGFPCNQFGAQEPGSDAEIAKFVKDNYKVNFPMFSKINVIGEDVPDFWQYLVDGTKKAPNWNFWKYLVDHTGKVVEAFGPQVAVEEVVPHVLRAIKKAKSEDASINQIKDAIAKAQAKMGDKAKGLKFSIKDDL